MKDKDILISIIVPVYGTEDFLSACIDSLCHQSYSNIQIILVDDKSLDRCPQICDEYIKKDARITVVHHQYNIGVSGARNTGMDIATGDYIMFVDSDDKLYPHAVEILVQDALRNQADIVSASQKIVDEKKNVISGCEDNECIIWENETSILLSLDGDLNTVSACAKLFKHSFIQGIRFEEGKNINEDGFFMFQCFLKKPKVVQHNVLIYEYSLRMGSNSKQVFSEKYMSMLYFCNKKKEIISTYYPQYISQVYNMEVRTNLELLQILCSSTEKKHREIQSLCIHTVRKLYMYHKPINKHHKRLARIIRYGLYPIYKKLVRFKYYR